MDRVDELVEPLLFRFRQWTRPLVAACEINIHIGRHVEGCKGYAFGARVLEAAGRSREADSGASTAGSSW